MLCHKILIGTKPAKKKFKKKKTDKRADLRINKESFECFEIKLKFNIWFA